MIKNNLKKYHKLHQDNIDDFININKNIEQKSKCNHCGKEFVNNSNLYRHQKINCKGLAKKTIYKYVKYKMRFKIKL